MLEEEIAMYEPYEHLRQIYVMLKGQIKEIIEKYNLSDSESSEDESLLDLTIPEDI